MRLVIPLLKASIVAAFVFAVAWIRLSGFGPSLRIAGGVFIAFGIPIVIMGLVVGFPIASLMVRFQVLRRWLVSAVGAIVGASLGFLFSYGAWRGSGSGEAENPFSLTFSPLHWHAPGFTDGIPFTDSDLLASILLAATVGAALGLSFSFFHSRATR